MSWRPRDHAAAIHQFMALLPLGEIWPREIGTTLYKVVAGLTGIVARFWSRAGTFLIYEAFPPTSLDLLPDWERVLGLPEPCFPVVDQTIAERQALVAEKIARRPGAQSRAHFLALCDRLGYTTATITEYRPAQCGMTGCGPSFTTVGRTTVRGAGCGTPYIRFVWTVAVSGARLTWFAHGAGGGRCGQDPHLRIARADDLECVLTKYKPAHTKLIFDYQGA